MFWGGVWYESLIGDKRMTGRKCPSCGKMFIPLTEYQEDCLDCRIALKQSRKGSNASTSAHILAGFLGAALAVVMVKVVLLGGGLLLLFMLSQCA